MLPTPKMAMSILILNTHNLMALVPFDVRHARTILLDDAAV